MNATVHQRILSLIEQTNDAFETYGHMNADYAEFATLAISDFKNALKNPNLTRVQLVNMLRRGMVKHSKDREPDTWAAFMAQHIARAANLDAPPEGKEKP